MGDDAFEANRRLNAAEIREGRTVLESLPQRLIVTLSSRCNIRCVMCEVIRSHWDMPERVVSEIESLFPVLESVSWQGGEPFALRGFERLFDEASRFPHLRQTIVSNGLLLTEEWARRLVRGHVELTISIDGTTRESYEKIRVLGKWDRLLDGLRLVASARRQGSDPRFKFKMHAVILRSNYRELDAFVDFAHEWGFEALHLIPVQGVPDSEEHIFHFRDPAIEAEIAEAVARAEEKARRWRIELLNAVPVRRPAEAPVGAAAAPSGVPRAAGSPRRSPICLLPFKEMSLDPGGGVRPGCICSKPIGSMLETSLKEIWNGGDMQTYRRRVASGEIASWCSEPCVAGDVPPELMGFGGARPTT